VADVTSAGFSGICIIICTDKGQHPRTVLGSIDESLDRRQLEHLNAPFLGGIIAERRADECVWFDDRGRLQMRCPL
jgi:hypothetical protein